MRNAQMNDALVMHLIPNLARIALKKIAIHKSTALEPQLHYAQLVEKIHQEDITKTHIDRHKINTYPTLSSSINKISLDIDNLTVADIRTREQDIAHGINVVRYKNSIDQNLKGKPLFLKFCKKKNVHNQDTVFPLALTNDTQNHLINLTSKNKFVNQAMRGNQSLPNKHVTTNNVNH